MRVLVIVNRLSGGGDASLYDYLRALGTLSDEITVRYFDGSMDIENMLHDAENFDRVVAAGGDGTVSAVSYALSDTKIPVLAYPAGTANLLALNLGIHPEPRVLAETTVAGPTAAFDLGVIERRGGEGQDSVVTGFIITAGAGYDAAIMEAAAPMKSTFGAAAYLLGAMGTLSPTHAKFEIDLDGEHISTDGIAVLVVNFGRIQFDIAFARGADPQDGMFDIAVVRSKNIAELVPTVVAGVFDRAGDRNSIPGIDVYSARRVSVVADPPLRMQYDGEVAEAFTPFTAWVLPRAATLVLPPDSPFAT